MTTKIRMTRMGSKKRPFYRIVISDSRSPRDGKFKEIVGTYNPMLKKEDNNRVVLNKDRIDFWLKSGAEPSEKVAKILSNNNIENNFIKKTVARLKSRPQVKSKKELKAAEA